MRKLLLGRDVRTLVNEQRLSSPCSLSGPDWLLEMGQVELDSE